MSYRQTIIKRIQLIVLFSLVCTFLYSQSFDAPDTVCVNTPVNITNTTQGAASNYWNFCAGDINKTPTGTNLGNIGGLLAMPVFMDYVFVNNNYYGFSINHYPGGLIRWNFGNSLLNTPTATDLGNFGGILPYYAEGIQVVQNEGRWYAIVVGGNAVEGYTPRVLKIDFGIDITNLAPVATDWGNLGNLAQPLDLQLVQENGAWYGFTVSGDNNTITRFNFTNSFNNIPTAVNLGSIGNLAYPTGIFAIKENNSWKVFITNGGDVSRTNGGWSMTRLDFGASLLNVPTGVNFGNPGGFLKHPRDLTILKFCGETIGFAVNGAVGSGDIVKIDFHNDLSAVPTFSSIGNVGNFSWPSSISKIFRVNADLYAFVTNVDDNTVTRLRFTGCNDSSIPSSALQNPPPVTYNIPGTYNINLTIDDGLPTQASLCKQVVVLPALSSFDFNYIQDICDPVTVHFNRIGVTQANSYWDFGDGSTLKGNINPVHRFPAMGNYVVKYSVGNGICSDTIQKTISINVIQDDLILTPDTTICYGSVKQLRTIPSLSFCWSPAIYLDHPSLHDPTTSTKLNITYYFTAEVTGVNLITNGNFSSGNSGFTSEYGFSNINTTEGQYFVGTSPPAWNSALNMCGDHTSGNGNMMMVNGAPTPDLNVWKQNVTVTPNTNYAFSTWIQSLWTPNPAQLQFSINGSDVGKLITASLPVCSWTQFYTTWNSGANTTAVISIVNKNTLLWGNDFTLDDMSFAPVFIKRDSVIIRVANPSVKTNSDTTICPGSTIQLNTTGAQTYSWSPAAGLSNTATPNPFTSPVISTQYIVTGTTVNGCIARDTIAVNLFAKPAIVRSSDTTICKNTQAQLSAIGGVGYSWTPVTTLSNPLISNPVASPTTDTRYYVTVTDNNTCQYLDSVLVSLRPDAVFSINGPEQVCRNGSFQLNASGGDIYSWSPAGGLNNSGIANPVASPSSTTDYSVTITESACNQAATLTTRLTVLPLPAVNAAKSNDIDCSNDRSQLSATGAVKYFWTPSITLNNPAVFNPVATPSTTTEYIVEGTDASGCKGYDTILVKVDNVDRGGYLMPNAFTPNNDGLNDCYGIKYWGVIKELEFSIYNRWGSRIFFTKDAGQCWDGTYKGTKQEGGVYVYMIRARTNCASEVFRKGTFVLVR